MKNKQLQKMINKLIVWSFKDGRIIESNVTRSIKLLKMQPRSHRVPVLLEYLKSLKRKQRQHTLYIETVIPLSVTQIEKMKRIVENKAKVTKVEAVLNPKILGGFRLQVGDEVWDASISAKLNQVKEAIIHGRYN